MGVTPQLFIFETLTHLIVIISCFLIYFKTRGLFKLSLQKGIKYFSNSFMFYTVCFFFRYILNILQIFEIRPMLQLLFSFLTMYCAMIGAFYLAYSLMWRKFEKDTIKVNKFIIPQILAIIIASSEVYLGMNSVLIVPFIFYGAAITTMLLAVYHSLSCCGKNKNIVNPYFLSTVSLGLGVYVLLFIEELIRGILPTVHFYAWGLVTIICVTLAFNVRELTK